MSVRHVSEKLERAFFSVRFVRKLDASGYARIRYWRSYCAEGRAYGQVALWLSSDSLTAEFAGYALARYEVACSPATGQLREVGNPDFSTPDTPWRSQGGSAWRRYSVKNGSKHSDCEATQPADAKQKASGSWHCSPLGRLPNRDSASIRRQRGSRR